MVSYELPAPATVNLRVYDAAGRVVRRLDEGAREAGLHRVRWDGRNDTGNHVAAGVYFYRLEVRGETATKQVILRN